MNRRAITIMAIGMAGAALSATTPAMAQSDDPNTLALWHMDSTISTTDRFGNLRNAIPDDDSANPGRDQALILDKRPINLQDIPDGSYEPTLVTGKEGFGSALEFDGGDIAYSPNFWNQNEDGVLHEQEEFRFSFDFNPGDSFEDNTALLSTVNKFQVRERVDGAGAAQLYLYTWQPGGVTDSGRTYKFRETNRWYHVEGFVSYDGPNGTVHIEIEGLEPDGLTVDGEYAGPAGYHHNAVYVGGNYYLSQGLDRPYTGMIDNVKISVITEAISGDFNADDVVDLADYTVWRDNLGAATEDSLNGNGDGENGVDVDDYTLWKSNFEAPTEGEVQAASVPEPSAVWLLISAVFAGGLTRLGSRGKSRFSP